MLQIRPGDLTAVDAQHGHTLFAILTKQIYFGGHWCFVFHDPVVDLSSEAKVPAGAGFNAFVDFIVPKRNGTISRLLRGQDFSHLIGPELLKQQPTKGAANYRIWRWKSNERREAEYVRFTPNPSEVELSAPEYSCLPADFACELAARRWDVRTTMWQTTQ